MDKLEFARAAYVRYGVLLDFDGEAPKRLAQSLKGQHETFAAFCQRVLDRRADEVKAFLLVQPAPNKRLSTLSELGRNPSLVSWSKASAGRQKQAKSASDKFATERHELTSRTQELQQKVLDLELKVKSLESERARAQVGFIGNDRSLTLKVADRLEAMLDPDALPQLDELVRKDAETLKSVCEDPEAFANQIVELIRHANHWRNDKASTDACLHAANKVIEELRRRHDHEILPRT